jgi:hypothetical protein
MDYNRKDCINCQKCIEDTIEIGDLGTYNNGYYNTGNFYCKDTNVYVIKMSDDNFEKLTECNGGFVPKVKPVIQVIDDELPFGQEILK